MAIYRLLVALFPLNSSYWVSVWIREMYSIFLDYTVFLYRSWIVLTLEILASLILISLANWLVHLKSL